MPTLLQFCKAVKSNNEEKKQKILDLQKEYPIPFKYLVIFPFIMSNSDPKYRAALLNNKLSYFLKIRDILIEEEKLYLFDEFSEYLFIYYKSSMSNLNNSFLIKLLSTLS